MADADRPFEHGSPNRDHFGFFSVRSSAVDEPDSKQLEAAAEQLGRQAFMKDDKGGEHEIIGAAISQCGQLAYVESHTKDGGANPHGFDGRHIDVSIQIHLVDSSGANQSVEIESYNPFFGCDVLFFEWIGDIAVLIYREKHWTFVYSLGEQWPPKFVKIEDEWLIEGDQLTYIGYKEDLVRRLRIPSLDQLDPLPIEEAAKQNLMPEIYWA